MSDTAFSRREELKGPPSPTTKVSKWLSSGKGKANEARKPEHVPIAASTHLNKLRDRLLSIRDSSGGSFSSNGSERIAPNPVSSTRESPSIVETKGTRSSKGAWRISAQSSELDDVIIPIAANATTVPSSRVNTTPSSAALPPRSPPRRSSSRLNPQPSPRTPARMTLTTAPPPRATTTTSSPNRSPRQMNSSSQPTAAAATGIWEEQLGVLDRLSKQLSITATKLLEDPSPEELRSRQRMSNEKQQQKPSLRRSSIADWEKYQELAAQLEEARFQLDNLDSSDDEDSFAALLEDN